MHSQMMLTAFIKPVHGYAWRKRKRTNRKIHFYDEREWRYVPQLPVGDRLFLTWDDLQDKKGVEAKNDSLRKKFSLRIEPDDIQYLIVPDEERVIQLARFIDTL